MRPKRVNWNGTSTVAAFRIDSTCERVMPGRAERTRAAMPETIGVAALVPQKPPNCECHLELQVQPGAATSTQEVEELDQS